MDRENLKNIVRVINETINKRLTESAVTPFPNKREAMTAILDVIDGSMTQKNFINQLASAKRAGTIDEKNFKLSLGQLRMDARRAGVKLEPIIDRLIDKYHSGSDVFNPNLGESNLPPQKIFKPQDTNFEVGDTVHYQKTIQGKTEILTGKIVVKSSGPSSDYVVQDNKSGSRSLVTQKDIAKGNTRSTNESKKLTENYSEYGVIATLKYDQTTDTGYKIKSGQKIELDIVGEDPNTNFYSMPIKINNKFVGYIESEHPKNILDIIKPGNKYKSGKNLTEQITLHFYKTIDSAKRAVTPGKVIVKIPDTKIDIYTILSKSELDNFPKYKIVNESRKITEAPIPAQPLAPTQPAPVAPAPPAPVATTPAPAGIDPAWKLDMVEFLGNSFAGMAKQFLYQAKKANPNGTADQISQLANELQKTGQISELFKTRFLTALSAAV